MAQFGGRGNRKFCIFKQPFGGIDTGSSESQTAQAPKPLPPIAGDNLSSIPEAVIS